MVDTEDWPKGRASALCMFGVMSGMSLVLLLAHLLSSGLHISLTPLYVWEIILFIFTLTAISWFVACRNNTGHVSDSVLVEETEAGSAIELSTTVDRSSRSQIREPFWVRIPLRELAVSVCCIGSISMPIYEAYRSIDNLKCFNIEADGLHTLLVSKCISNIFCFIICICLLVFALIFKNKSAKSSEMKVLMSTTAATNFTLVVNVAMNIIWTSNTIEANSETPQSNVSDKHIHFNTSQNEIVKEMIYVKCFNNTGYVDSVATYLYKYSYQFPVEFALLSFCFLGNVWNVLPHIKRTTALVQRQTSAGSGATEGDRFDSATLSEGDREPSEQEPLLGRTIPERSRFRRVKLVAMSTFVFCCNHIIIPTVLLVAFIFSFHLYTEIQDDTFDDENVILQCQWSNHTCAASQNSVIQTIYTYVFSIVAFIGFMVARKEKKSFDFFNATDILLLIGAGGHLLLILFETIDNIDILVVNDSKNTTAEKVLFSFKTFCRCIGLYSQTIFVLKSRKIKISHISMKTGRQLVIKALVVFLGVCNTEIWLADSFLEPTVLQYNENTNYGQAYGRKNWFFLTQSLYPLVTLYRLLTAVMCFEACVRFKRTFLRENVD